MNPAAAAVTSAGIAGAAVTVLNGFLSHWGIAPDAAMVTAEGTLFTFAAGVGLHYLTRVSPDVAAVVAPEAPKP